MRTLLRILTFNAAITTGFVALLGRARIGAWPLEWFANFSVQILFVAIALLLVATALKSKFTFTVCVIAVVVSGTTVAGVLRSDRDARRHGAAVVIGHLNAQSGKIEVNALRAMLRREAPDVFVILEPSQSDVRSLQRDAAGYTAHTTATKASPPWVRTIVLSRIPIANVRHREAVDLPPATVEYTIMLNNKPVTVMALHTASPTTPGRAQERNRALRATVRWSNARAEDHVVMGDFNATPWSPEFVDTETNGQLRSSLRGFGQQASWPSELGWLGLAIDHALLSKSLVTVSRDTTDSFGSEHRGLLVGVARSTAVS